MRIFVTIITVAFLAHWTCSLINKQWCWTVGAFGGNFGGNVIHSLLSAVKHLSHYFLILPLSFNRPNNYYSFNTERKSCNDISIMFCLTHLVQGFTTS